MVATASLSEDGRIEFQLSLNLEAAIAGIGAEHDRTEASPRAAVYDDLRSLSPRELRLKFETFSPSLLDGIGIAVDGQRRVLGVEGVDIPPVGDESRPRISNLRLSAEASDRPTSFTWHAHRELGDSVVRLRDGNSDEILHAVFVPGGESSGPISLEDAVPATWFEVARQYLSIGFVHILPKGLDHIFFVVGLFLLSARLAPLLWQVTAFTFAHTVSLALAALGVVSIPAQIIEPVIALSIAWIALENLITDRLRLWRPFVVFAFGLVHGLGFAGVLDEIGVSPDHFLTSLVAFNLGVELGQLAVIALCFVVVGWMMRWQWYRAAIVRPASLVIAAVAIYWAIERALYFNFL